MSRSEAKKNSGEPAAPETFCRPTEWKLSTKNLNEPGEPSAVPLKNKKSHAHTHSTNTRTHTRTYGFCICWRRPCSSGIFWTSALCCELHSGAVFRKGSLRGSWTVRKTRQRKSHPVAPTAAHLAKPTICAWTLSVQQRKGGKIKELRAGGGDSAVSGNAGSNWVF